MAIFSDQELKFSGPARYRLVIKGNIPQDKLDHFGGFEMHVVGDSPATYKTELIGEILDQAGLAGILNTIYSFQLPLLEVEYLKPIR